MAEKSAVKMAEKSAVTRVQELSPFDPETGALRVIIETPRGSRSKIKYDVELGIYKLSHVLPAGMVFPFDFGFVPGTKGEDGDPIDVLVLIDGSTQMGCLLLARLIGVIEAEQTEAGKTGRNDRLLAVALESREHSDVESIGSIGGRLLDEIEHFFASYNELRGKQFVPIGRYGPERAMKLVKAGIEKPSARPKRSRRAQAASRSASKGK
jgi:inorganic pyrophosphatase